MVRAGVGQRQERENKNLTLGFQKRQWFREIGDGHIEGWAKGEEASTGLGAGAVGTMRLTTMRKYAGMSQNAIMPMMPKMPNYCGISE